MNSKRIFTSLFTGSMALAMAVSPVLAASETTAVIDQTKGGTLTLHKLIENDGNNKEADGLPAGTNDIPAETRIPVDNIEFSYWKIADIENVAGYNAAGKAVSGLYYTNLNPDFVSALKNQAGANVEVEAADIVVGGDATKKYYTTEAIEKAMKQVIASAGEVSLNSMVKSKGAAMPRTAADGSTHIDYTGAQQGLYIIAETDISYHDGAAGTVDDGGNTSKVNGVAISTVSGENYYVVNSATGRLHDDRMNTETDHPATQSSDSASGKINDNGAGSTNATATKHSYKKGEMYQESTNPEAPIVQTIASPFLVSLPTTNTAVVDGAVDNQTEGTVWQYDVDVYPKNQTTQVVKRIIDPDEKEDEETMRTHEDYQIGDKIQQVIWADVPSLQQNYLNWSDNDKEVNGADQLSDEQDFSIEDTMNKHTIFKISDTMSAGWTFDEVTKVVLVNKPATYRSPEEASGTLNVDSNQVNYNTSIPVKINEYDFTESADGGLDGKAVTLVKGTDYTVTAEGADDNGAHGFTVELTATGLAKINAAPFASTLQTDATSGKQTLVPGKEVQMMVFFDTTLNKVAKIGETYENQNFPTLTWATTTQPEARQIRGNEVYAFTYELDITKSGLDDATKARFIVGRTDVNDLAQDASKNLSNYVSATDADGKPISPAPAKMDEDGVRWVKEADGVYHVYDYAQKNSTAGNILTDARVDNAQHGDNIADPNKDTAAQVSTAVGAIEVSEINGTKYYTVTPARDGKLVLKGFDSNKYTFKEIQTEDESNLLKTSFDVTFTAEDPQRDGKLKTAVVDMDGTSANLNIETPLTDANGETRINHGIASLTVNNYDAVDLRTGGRGRMLIYASAIAMAGVLGVAAFVTRKQEDEA